MHTETYTHTHTHTPLNPPTYPPSHTPDPTPNTHTHSHTLTYTHHCPVMCLHPGSGTLTATAPREPGGLQVRILSPTGSSALEPG